MKVVLDCSAALSLVLDDEHDERAERLHGNLKKLNIVVPSIWPAELANGLRTAYRRGRVAKKDLHPALAMFDRLHVIVDDTPIDAAETLDAAMEFDLSACDALYLLLARREGMRLVTLDQRLEAAAARARIPLYQRTSP